MNGATRQCLKSERSASGIQVEHPRVGQRLLQDTHPCFADPIGGGADPRGLRTLQGPAAELAGDDSHAAGWIYGTRAGPCAPTSSITAAASLGWDNATIRAWRLVTPWNSFCSSRNATSTGVSRTAGLSHGARSAHPNPIAPTREAVPASVALR